MLIDEKSNRGMLGHQKEAIYHIIIRGQVTDSLIHIVDCLQMRRENEDDMISLIGSLPV